MGRTSRDRRDVFYRKAKEEGYRARSAYKLLQIMNQIPLIDAHTCRAVDLCAAPGSWSQVLVSCLSEKQNYQDLNEDRQTILGDDMTHASQKNSIVAVDLQEIAPLRGVTTLQADITREATAHDIMRKLGGNRADLIVCDGAPDVTGLHELDEYLQHQLLYAALNISTCLLRHGAHFVTKLFRGKSTAMLCAKMRTMFEWVTIVKPRSSRNSSMECFIVARNFHPYHTWPPSSFAFSLMEPRPLLQEDSISATPPAIIPFLVCGDLSGYDADVPRQISGPVLPPIAPSSVMTLRHLKNHGQ